MWWIASGERSHRGPACDALRVCRPSSAVTSASSTPSTAPGSRCWRSPRAGCARPAARLGAGPVEPGHRARRHAPGDHHGPAQRGRLVGPGHRCRELGHLHRRPARAPRPPRRRAVPRRRDVHRRPVPARVAARRSRARRPGGGAAAHRPRRQPGGFRGALRRLGGGAGAYAPGGRARGVGGLPQGPLRGRRPAVQRARVVPPHDHGPVARAAGQRPVPPAQRVAAARGGVPGARLVERWKGEADLPAARQTIAEFLAPVRP